MKLPRPRQTGRYLGVMLVFFFVQCFLYAQTVVLTPDETPAKLGITLSAALNLPQEDFGKTDNNKSGFATSGFALTAEYDRLVVPNWFWSTSVTAAMNGMNETELKNQMYRDLGVNLNVDAGYYTSIWLLTGAKYMFPRSDFYSSLQIGVLQSVFPDITISNSAISVKQTTTSKTAVGISIAVGYRIKNYDLGLKVNSGTPTYNQTATGGNLVSKQTLDLPMDILLVYAGIGF